MSRKLLLSSLAALALSLSAPGVVAQTPHSTDRVFLNAYGATANSATRRTPLPETSMALLQSA